MSIKKHLGFTLIELVMVIVILGILAAFVIPRYMSLDKNARVSTIHGLKGALRAASVATRVTAKVKGVTANVVTLDTAPYANVSVDGATYYPTAATNGIVASLESTEGFAVSSANNVTTFTLDGAPTPADCSVTYTLNAGSAPDIVNTDTGC